MAELRLTDHEEELYAVQAKRAGLLQDSEKFSGIIVSGTGRMARMNTISPQAFAGFKRWLATQSGRDPLKRRRDSMQAELVETLIEEYFVRH